MTIDQPTKQAAASNEAHELMLRVMTVAARTEVPIRSGRVIQRDDEDTPYVQLSFLPSGLERIAALLERDAAERGQTTRDLLHALTDGAAEEVAG